MKSKLHPLHIAILEIEKQLSEYIVGFNLTSDEKILEPVYADLSSFDIEDGNLTCHYARKVGIRWDASVSKFKYLNLITPHFPSKRIDSPVTQQWSVGMFNELDLTSVPQEECIEITPCIRKYVNAIHEALGSNQVSLKALYMLEKQIGI
jgi:hypothetical protein